MMTSSHKYLFILLVFIAACKSDPVPEPVVELPVFGVKGTIGNDSLEIFAGVGDYFMDSHFEKDNMNVYSFNGTFKKRIVRIVQRN